MFSNHKFHQLSQYFGNNFNACRFSNEFVKLAIPRVVYIALFAVACASNDVRILYFQIFAYFSDFFCGLIAIFKGHANVRNNEKVPLVDCLRQILKQIDCFFSITGDVNKVLQTFRIFSYFL